MHWVIICRINDNVSLTLKELVKQILPLASHYSMVQRFTEEKMRFEFGQVNNALAEAMQDLLNDHMVYSFYCTKKKTHFFTVNIFSYLLCN